MPTVLQTNQTMLFIGDSITDCGRRDPQHRPLGCGYVRMFVDMVTIREPQKHIAFINRGIGGQTLEDLRSRWYDDVIWHAPDWLSIKIGINDINQHLVNPDRPLRSPAEYRAMYQQVLDRTLDALPNVKLLLIEPFYMSRDTTEDAYRAKVLAKLQEYRAVVHEMAEKYSTRLVRLHDIFQQQLDHRHPDAFGDEPVHPNATGHLLIAESVYDAMSQSEKV